MATRAGGQAYGEARGADRDLASVKHDALAGMLAVGARLDDHGPRGRLAEVHETERGGAGRHPLDERGDVRRQTRPPRVGVEVADAAVQHGPTVTGGDPAHDEAEQRVDRRGVVAERVVGKPRVGRGRVLADRLDPGANPAELAAERLLGIARGLALEEGVPVVAWTEAAVFVLHRPVPEFVGPRGVGRRPVIVPPLVAVHVGVERPAVDDLRVGIDRGQLFPPDVEVAVVSGEQISIAEPDQGEVGGVPRDELAGDGVLVSEVPAVNSRVPGPGGAADGPVESDLGREDPVVGDRPLAPGVDVLEEPFFVFRFMRQHVGVQGECGGAEVRGMVADHVVVALKVGDHLCIGVLTVPGLEAVLDLDRVAGPVEAGGRAEERAAAAVDETPDDLVRGVVVRGAGVFVHVEPGIAADAAGRRAAYDE